MARFDEEMVMVVMMRTTEFCVLSEQLTATKMIAARPRVPPVVARKHTRAFVPWLMTTSMTTSVATGTSPLAQTGGMLQILWAYGLGLRVEG